MTFLVKKENLKILLFLIPVSFIIGIALTEFFVLLSIIFFIFLNKDKSIFKDSKIIFLLLFSLYIFLNSYFQITDRSKDLLLSSLFHFRFLIFSLSIFCFCKIFEDSKENIFFLLFIFSIFILLLDSIFQFFSGINFLGYEILSGRVSSFFEDELILGSFLVRLLPIIFWFIFFLRFDLKKNFFYLVVFFSLYFISIYLSGERTSFFLSSILIFSIFFVIKKLRSILTYSILIFTLFALCTSYFKIGSTDLVDRMFVKTFNQMTDNKIVTNKNNKVNLENISKNLKIYSSDHEGHLKLAFKLFSENKIFGVGPRGFRYYCRGINYNSDEGVCSTHPHNILIQIVSELGLIGLFFYIVAGIFVLFNLFKLIFKREYGDDYLSFYSITFGLIINLFPFIPGGDFFNNWISIVLYYNIGFYLYSYKKCVLK
jgi:hypothetical protein